MKLYINKRSKSIIALLLFITTIVVNAQPPGVKPHGPPPVPTKKQVKKIVADVSEELVLNDVQNEQISALFFDHFVQVRKLSSSDRNDFHSMEAMKSDFENEVLELLSDEQKKLFKAHLKRNAPIRKHN